MTLLDCLTSLGPITAKEAPRRADDELIAIAGLTGRGIQNVAVANTDGTLATKRGLRKTPAV